jgi:hypothetical protein
MTIRKQSLPLVTLLAGRLTAHGNLADSTRTIIHEASPHDTTGHILFCEVRLSASSPLIVLALNVFVTIHTQLVSNFSYSVGLQVFTIVTMKWRFSFLTFSHLCKIWGSNSDSFEEYHLLGYKTQCGPLRVDRRFGGTYRHHLQSYFNPEDRGNMFLRNID